MFYKQGNLKYTYINLPLKILVLINPPDPLLSTNETLT